MILESTAIDIGTKVGIPIILHVGKKVGEDLWQLIKKGLKPIFNSKNQRKGNNDSPIIGYVPFNEERILIPQSLTVPEYQPYTTVFGNLYLLYTLSSWMLGTAIPLVMVIEETQQEVILFGASLEEGFELCLVEGIYSFYIFLVDGNANDLFDAEIFAMGFPSLLNLTGRENFMLEDHQDIWNLVSDSPIEITGGEIYSLDFILVDNNEIFDSRIYFSDLLGNGMESDYQLSGLWRLVEEYEFGSTEGRIYLTQYGNQVFGLMITQDIMDDGEELIIQEACSGEIEGQNIELQGSNVLILKGVSNGYELDNWRGIIENNNRISGVSVDRAGTSGVFIMERLLEAASTEATLEPDLLSSSGISEQIKALASSENPESFLRCPICAAEVKAKNLVHHLNKVHPTIVRSPSEPVPSHRAKLHCPRCSRVNYVQGNETSFSCQYCGCNINVATRQDKLIFS